MNQTTLPRPAQASAAPEPAERADSPEMIFVPLTFAGVQDALDQLLDARRASRQAEETRLHREAVDSAAAGRGTLDWGGGLTRGSDTGTSDTGPSALARAQHALILEDAGLVEGLGRRIDAARIEIAGRVMRASDRRHGPDGLARTAGFRTGSELLAALTGTSAATAGKRARLAAATEPVPGLTGANTPARFPAVHDALIHGEIGLDAAQAITAGLGSSFDRVGHLPEFADAEQALVGSATGTAAGLRHTADDVRVFVARAIAHLDPDGQAPTLDEQRASRGLRLTELSSGMTRVTGQLDPETAAIWHAVLSPTRRQLGKEFTEAGAETAPSGQVTFRPVRADAGDASSSDGDGSDSDADGSHADSDNADTRTPTQRLLDRATEALKARLTEPAADTGTGTAALVHVHVRAEDLEAGRGIAWLDGSTAPVGVGAAERNLCSGTYTATVFGEHGQVLAQGRTQRLFTKRQALALRARDGGCRWPGCRTAPRDCEAHHIIPWSHGGHTDTDNGVLLCQFHHTLVHERMGDQEAWQIRSIGGVPHLVPPFSADWAKRPRPMTQDRWHPPGRQHG